VGLKKMKRIGILIVFSLGLGLFGQPGWAEKAYVTDSFEITLRTGPSVSNKIMTLLHSDQPLEILEVQDAWTHVRILEQADQEVDGWVLSRYLITREPWKDQAKTLKQENARLREKLDHSETQGGEAARRVQGLARRLKEATEGLHDLQNKYEALKRGSADYLNVKAEYEKTSSSLEAAQKTVKGLTQRNDRLKSSDRNSFFAMGALVLLFGLMIGLAIGRQQKKRKSLLYD